MVIVVYRYLVVLFVFLAIDMVWLGILAGDLYGARIGQLLGPVNWLAAILFYLIYCGGIAYFAIHPAKQQVNNSVRSAAFRGALLGIFAYGTYDLTNLATLKDWPIDIVIIDMAWGMFLTAVVAAISCQLWTKWGIG